jgi:beta-xylosidase
MILGPIIAAALAAAAPASSSPDLPWRADVGDGTYRNPVLAGDYSDPDVVRVGDDFYLVSSSFTNVPGLPILHSRDLVNWTIVGHALDHLEPKAHFAIPRRGGGVWAPAIRYHAGRFLIYYPDPDYGLFVVSAKDPRGPWSAPKLVWDAKGAIDPAPFWDKQGRGWLVNAWAGSRAGFNNVITLSRLSGDGTKVVGQRRDIIKGADLAPVLTRDGVRRWRVIEGPKLYYRAGYYYVFAPAGGVKQGWQGVFRARSIEGPYEARNVLDQGKAETNGPHQGAWVTTPAGEDWFLHFQDRDGYGRVVHLQPMHWRDGWPVIGSDPDGDGRGEPVATWRKPALPTQPIAAPQADDEFDRGLGKGWQWNSNPANDWAVVGAGRLRLKSVTAPANLYEAGNLLAQKLPAPTFSATAKVSFAPLRVGERTGLAIAGTSYAFVGLENTADGIRLVQESFAEKGVERAWGPVVGSQPVWLRMHVEPVELKIDPPSDPEFDLPAMRRAIEPKARFSYSLDGVTFQDLGGDFVGSAGRWTGAQIGLFATAPYGSPASVATSVGYADFDWFHVGR